MAASNTGPASADATYAGLKARIEPNFKLASPIITLLESIEINVSEVFVSRYAYNFNESFTKKVLTDSVDPGFLIVGKKITNGKPEYVSVEETSTGVVVLDKEQTSIHLEIRYDLDERSALDFGAPFVNPSLAATTQQPSDPYYVNTIMSTKINYNSLSSLGSTITEELAVSIDGTQSETIGFDVQAQTITDTGGPSVAARTDRTFEAFDSAGAGTTSTAKITTGRTEY